MVRGGVFVVFGMTLGISFGLLRHCLAFAMGINLRGHSILAMISIGVIDDYW